MLAAEPPTEPTKPFPAPVEEDDDMVARTMSVNTYAKRWRLKSASRALPALAPFVPRMLKEDLASVTPHYPSIRHMAAAQRAPKLGASPTYSGEDHLLVRLDDVRMDDSAALIDEYGACSHHGLVPVRFTVARRRGKTADDT